MKGAGFVVGVLVAWAAVIGLNESGYRLARQRAISFGNAYDKTLPWVIAIVAIALVLGVLLGVKSGFGAGALVGAGLLMTGAGLGTQVLPVRTAVQISEWFELPGGRRTFGYVLWDGSVLFFGVVLLIVGLMRWRTASTPAPAYPGGPYPYQPATQYPSGPSQYPNRPQDRG